MGLTRFSGPVYGAKSLLATVSRASVAASQTDLEIAEFVVPSDEDWYVTGVQAFCTNQGNGGSIDVESPNGTSLLGSNLALSSGVAVSAVVTPDGGEDEGKRVASGQRVHVEASNGATTAVADLTVSLYGYIRKAGTL